jgi:hypothetical protein
MHFNNPLPRTGLPQFSEQSSQQSLRESGGTGQLWKKASKTTAQESANTRALQQVNQKIERLRRRIIGSGMVEPYPTTVTLCQITDLYSTANVHRDYFGVRAMGGNGLTMVGSMFNVAKSFPSRMIANAVVNGVTYDYTYTDDNYRQSVNRSNAADTEDQQMTPLFFEGQLIHAMPVNFTLAFENATRDIKVIEVSTEREWTAPPP